MNGRARWVGVAPALAAAVLWATTPRPDILIDAEARVIGVLTDKGRALNQPKRGAFAAGTWLENDGDGATQEEASARPARSSIDGVDTWVLGHGRLLYQTGGSVPRCDGNDILLTKSGPTNRPGCTSISIDQIKRNGAVAIYLTPTPRIVFASDRTGDRPWTRAGP